MSGTLAVPLKRREAIPQIIVPGDFICQLGQGFSNLPFFVWCALEVVKSSSGLGPVVEGEETVAAYSRAAAVEDDICRGCWTRVGMVLDLVRKRSRKKDRIGDRRKVRGWEVEGIPMILYVPSSLRVVRTGCWVD